MQLSYDINVECELAVIYFNKLCLSGFKLKTFVSNTMLAPLHRPVTLKSLSW
jgi:hypothetical protein